VTRPILLHVEAKRYLCRIDALYAAIAARIDTTRDSPVPEKTCLAPT
jgi:predicted HD phosphohydrolase